MTTPLDYDANPERFRLAARVTRRHLTAPSLYELLAEALAPLEPRRILDLGCGEGALRAALPARLAGRTVGLDAAATMLAAVWRPAPSSFDAEDGPGLVASVFGRVEVERWDAPLVRLPDRDAVRDYLIARFVAPEDAAAAAERVATPVTVTKRGALVYARR